MTRKYWLLAGALLTLLAAAGSSPQLIDRAFAESAASSRCRFSRWTLLGRSCRAIWSWVLPRRSPSTSTITSGSPPSRTVPAGKISAPPVVKLGPDGKYVRGWGDENSTAYDWPDAEHNVYVDQNDNVYISGSSPSGQSKTLRSDDMS